MFGLTVFESVLERLKAERLEAQADDDGDTPQAESGEVRGLPSGFAGLGSGSVFVSGSQAASAYLDLYEEPPAPGAEPEQPPLPPPHLLRTDPVEVAADLDLTGRETPDELAERRRAFARLNHPDRVDPAMRENATVRMKIANMLIDETIRRIRVENAIGFSR